MTPSNLITTAITLPLLPLIASSSTTLTPYPISIPTPSPSPNFNPPIPQNTTTRFFTAPTTNTSMNSTGAWEIWYMDFISPNLTTGVDLAFNVTPANSFLNTNPTPAIMSFIIDIMLPNGSHFTREILPTRASVTENLDLSLGLFEDRENRSRVAWGNTAKDNRGDGRGWLDLDIPEIGLRGKVRWESIAPPHLPCSPANPGSTQELVPNLWWINQGPDLRAIVEFEIEGEKIEYTGIGYFDKNWTTRPLPQILGPWYWGHAHLGPYSLVWYDLTSITNTKHYSSYISKDGRILTANCDPNALSIKPFNAEGEYLPTGGKGNGSEGVLAEGFTVSMDVGEARFVVNVSNEVVFLENESPPARRWVGGVRGGWVGAVGGEVFEGVGFWEEVV